MQEVLSTMASATATTTTALGVSTVSSSFAYDSDEEPPQDESINQFFWRLPPEESHSDWTIEIITEAESTNDDDDNDSAYHPLQDMVGASPQCTSSTSTQSPPIAVYHVHKCILAAGPRRCEYFTRLFHSDSFSEATSRTSRITLHPLAAQAFSILLDYVYMTKEPLHITTEMATALHFLGQYFENRKLRWEAKQFWKADLEFANCHVYYQHAKVFSDDKLLEAITQCCVQNFFVIQASSAIIKVSDPAFWPGILEQLERTKEASLHASFLVTQICMLHKDRHPRHMNRELFEALTDKAFLPYIYEAIAKELLDLHDHFRQRNNHDPVSTIRREEEIEVELVDEQGKQSSLPHQRQPLSSLQRRCIDALAENWRGIPVAKDGLTEELRSQDPRVLAELLAKSLFQAQAKVERDEKNMSRMRQALEEREATLCKTEARLQDANTGWLRALNEVEALKQELTEAQEGWRRRANESLEDKASVDPVIVAVDSVNCIEMIDEPVEMLGPIRRISSRP